MPQIAPAASSDLLERAQAIHEQIRTWRRTIHRYPELSFTETQTAKLVADTLESLGVEFETGVAKTGVVGYIKGNLDSPTVGLRADMDALPILEANGTDFDSTRPGLMHACGHDVHTAMLLGAATLLKGLADEGALPGNVRLLFQPSEENADDEGKSGGQRMVEEGALDGLKTVFGLHVDSSLEVGQVGTCSGPFLAAADSFELIIKGRGAHAAEPQQSVDPIALSAHVINAIHQVVSRRLDPIDSGVLTIANINGGTGATNIIGTQVTLRGTMRSLTAETRQLLRAELEKAGALVRALDGDFELTIHEGYPVTMNDAGVTEQAMSAMANLLGEDGVTTLRPILASEDFSYMAQRIPGCFTSLGVKNPSWDKEYPVHTATFRIDEDALPIGSAVLVVQALEALKS